MKRNKRSILVSLSYEGDQLRLSLDDVARSVDENDSLWQKVDHYTSKLIGGNEFDTLSFDEKDLADFGYSILARLYAFKENQEI